MITYHIISCLIPQAFADDDVACGIIVARKFGLDEDSWQHSIKLPSRRVYSKGMHPLIVPTPAKTSSLDEDFWQQSLSTNITTKVTLWQNSDESIHKN